MRTRIIMGGLIALMALCSAAPAAARQDDDFNAFLIHCRDQYFGKISQSQYDSMPLDAWARVLGMAYRVQWDQTDDMADGAAKNQRKQKLQNVWGALISYVERTGDQYRASGYNSDMLFGALNKGYSYYGFGDRTDYALAATFRVANPAAVPALFAEAGGGDGGNSGGGESGGNGEIGGNENGDLPLPPTEGRWHKISPSCQYSIRSQGDDDRFIYYHYRDAGGVNRYYLYRVGEAVPRYASFERVGEGSLAEILTAIKERCSGS